LGLEHLDNSTSVSSYTVGKLGKIMVTNNNWYLPFVDLSSAGSLQYIRVFSFSVFSALEATSTINSVVLNATGAVNWFTNDLDTVAFPNRLVIGSVNTDGLARIHSYSLAGAPLATVNLFGGSQVANQSLRISAPVAGNPFHFAAARVLRTLPADYEWMIGRYDSGLTVSAESAFYDATSGNSALVLEDDLISDISLQSMPNNTMEARLLVTAGTNPGFSPYPVNLYTVRFRSSNVLTCGVCTRVNTGSQMLSSAHRIASTWIDSGMTIGTSGSSATATENTSEVLFSAYHVDTSGFGLHRPYLGIFNMRAESIQSTSSDTTGLLGHRPPFIGSN
jgi:hypothetical protein